MKDVELLEDVQRKFVKNVMGSNGKSYEERLHELNLITLSDRRVYLDLVEAYKIIYGINCNDPSVFFDLTGSGSRRNTRLTGYPRNIIPKRCNLDVRLNFFTQHITKPWNDLPNDIKDSPNVGCFKNRLKKCIMTLHSGHNGAQT